MDLSELATYYGATLDELHLPFNFITLKEPWGGQTMKNTLQAYYDALPDGATPNFVFGNHDTHRLATRYGYENHRSVGMLLLTLRGAPTMYYGDELGMLDVYIPPEALQDPVALRKPDSDDGRDPERAPMPWNEEPNAGFCPPEAAPWLPIPDNYIQINVANQARDPDSTLNFYRRLLQIRRKSTALQFGKISFLDVSSSDVLAYMRCAPKEDILVIINFAPSEQAVQGSIHSKMGELLLSTLGQEPGEISLENIQLAAHESMLILLK